jgi:hypothetical protein
MSMWTIYDHPRDYPAGFVVREWFILRGQTQPVPAASGIGVDTLEEARACVPRGLMRLPRAPHDDPAVAETWV